MGIIKADAVIFDSDDPFTVLGFVWYFNNGGCVGFFEFDGIWYQILEHLTYLNSMGFDCRQCPNNFYLSIGILNSYFKIK